MEIEIIVAIFFVRFETASKFPTVFARSILGKVEVDGVNGPRREIDIWYEFNLKVM